MTVIDAVEKRYTLAQAAEVIPMPSIAALKMFLHRHPGVAKKRYQRFGRRRWRYRQPCRILTLGEIRAIQELLSTEK